MNATPPRERQRGDRVPSPTWAVARRRFAPFALALLVSGCASLSPDGNLADLQQLSQGRTQGADTVLTRDPQAIQAALAEWLKRPLGADAAVRIALLNNPGLQASFATLGISDAARVQASTLPNPHLALGRFREGDKVEIERALSFNVMGLLSLPWRARWQGQQHELAKLQAAQDVVRLAADTRKAWIRAVAAQQSLRYQQDVKEAAEAGAELARRMARVGNWSRLQQAREQVFLAESLAQLARAGQTAVAEREKLVRLMGLWGGQTGFTLAERLPDLPQTATAMTDIEAQALRERLDVRSAVAESAYVAQSLGFVKASGVINVLTVGAVRNTTFDNASGTWETRRGAELELPLPLFDWGGANNARAEGVYRRSTERVREVAVKARSEAREAYHGYRTAYDLARHHRDELVPLRRFINDELLLRYNGMLTSVWDLLADTRALVFSTQGAIAAQRDFWLADADLQMVLSGTSPGALSAPVAATPGTAPSSQGH